MLYGRDRSLRPQHEEKHLAYIVVALEVGELRVPTEHFGDEGAELDFAL